MANLLGQQVYAAYLLSLSMITFELLHIALKIRLRYSGRPILAAIEGERLDCVLVLVIRWAM